MNAFRDDDVKGWNMLSDGSYRKAEVARGTDSQERLTAYFSARTVEPLPVPVVKKKKRCWLYRLFHG